MPFPRYRHFVIWPQNHARVQELHIQNNKFVNKVRLENLPPSPREMLLKENAS